MGKKGACEHLQGTVVWDSSPWGPGSNERQRCSPAHTEAYHSELGGRPTIFPDNVLNNEFILWEVQCNPLYKSVSGVPLRNTKVIGVCGGLALGLSIRGWQCVNLTPILKDFMV